MVGPPSSSERQIIKGDNFQNHGGNNEEKLRNFFLCLGQARLDGAFCSYTEKDKMEYIAWLKEGGVANIEMESTCFAALTYQAGIRSSIVCVALLDRLNEDQVSRDMQ